MISGAISPQRLQIYILFSRNSEEDLRVWVSQAVLDFICSPGKLTKEILCQRFFFSNLEDLGTTPATLRKNYEIQNPSTAHHLSKGICSVRFQ